MYRRCGQYLGFTLIELVTTLAIAGFLVVSVVPQVRSSIIEHRILSLLALFKADLEWARNQALSTNQRVTISLSSNTSCLWTTSINATTLETHKMTDTELSKHYAGVSCAFTGSSPVFNGLGLVNTGSLTGVFSSDATIKQWTLNLLGSGTIQVKTQ